MSLRSQEVGSRYAGNHANSKGDQLVSSDLNTCQDLQAPMLRSILLRRSYDMDG